jgi:hypothetical protein
VLDCCILFIYHRTNEVTRRHLELAKEHNPDIPIIPLSDVEDGFPGTIKATGRWKIFHPWKHVDYNWYENHRIEAERYIIFEWDCLCNTSVRSFYEPVWDCDLAVSKISTMNDGWWWFKEYERVKPLTPCGAIPIAGSLISKRLLDKISEGPVLQNVFCELRLGSLAVGYNAKIGLMPCGDNMLLARSEDECVNPGVYHPVKV